MTRNLIKHTPCTIALLPAMLAAVLLTACHSDDTTEPDAPTPQQPLPVNIGSVQELDRQQSSRAAGLETKGVTDFRLWGYKTMSVTTVAPYIYSSPQCVMERYVVKYTPNSAGTTADNTANWHYLGLPLEGGPDGESQTIKYWDFSATSYRFFGFAPSDELAPSVNYNYPVLRPDGSEWLEIVFPADAEHPEAAPYISKLWFSTNEAANYQYGECVTMQFMKPVSMVRIIILNSRGEVINDPEHEGFTSLEFKPIEDKPIIRAGNLRVSYPITGPSTFTNYTPLVEIEGDPTGTVRFNRIGTDYKDFYRVLPHVEQQAYQLIARVGGEQRIATVPGQYMSWNPNVEYTYYFKMGEQELQFIDIVQIGVTEWRTESSSHPIYNW